ncbi:hypothetical protein O181_003175 [Austropuccinia psidii MF-1]|uniref:Uncharacterized protein n=1 Tax=Austropuccinia psidii MF-1 TaxID=1389203 RepID=A0A9Q3BDW8_9BASI|nr:hypothetical protein [Austropuccinia psidii MF-1]
MRPKGAKGEVNQLPKPGGPTSASFGPKSQPTQNGLNQPQDHLWATIQPMASGNHQRPPAQLQAKIPPSFRGRFFLSQCTLYSRIQEWCIYGRIYHYALFLLRNPIMTFPGPNYMIPNQVPNPSPILKEDLSAIPAWQFPGSYQKTIQGSQPPGPAGVGLSFSHQDYSKGNSQRLSIFSVIVKASSTQHFLDNSIGP